METTTPPSQSRARWGPRARRRGGLQNGNPIPSGGKDGIRDGSGVEGCTADARPALEGTPVTGFPIGVIGFQGETGVDDHVKGGFVLKAHVYGVVAAGGKEFNEVDGLALELFHAMEAAVGVTANSGLAAPGNDGRREEGKIAFSGFDGGFGCGVGAAATVLRPRDGVFTLSDSHGLPV